MDTGAQTEPALPPYTPRPEGEIVKDALERAHPKLIVPSASPGLEHDHEHGTVVENNMSLEKTAEWAAMYAGLCSEVGIRCEVLERALKERQEGVIARLGEGESVRATIPRLERLWRLMQCIVVSSERKRICRPGIQDRGKGRGRSGHTGRSRKRDGLYAQGGRYGRLGMVEGFTDASTGNASGMDM